MACLRYVCVPRNNHCFDDFVQACNQPLKENKSRPLPNAIVYIMSQQEGIPALDYYAPIDIGTCGSEESCTCRNNLATLVDVPPTILFTDDDLDEKPSLINTPDWHLHAWESLIQL